jgi:hypothetical protein
MYSYSSCSYRYSTLHVVRTGSSKLTSTAVRTSAGLRVHRVSLIGTLLPLPSIQPLPGQTVCCDTSLDTSDWCGARGQQARFQPDRWQQWPRSRGSVSVNYTRMHAYRLAVVWDRTRRRRLAAPQRPSTSLARASQARAPASREATRRQARKGSLHHHSCPGHRPNLRFRCYH